jgi:uracil-DNA glycosylase
MRISEFVSCPDFPCSDVRHDGYLIPEVDLDPAAIKIMLISEAAPGKQEDYYYAPGNPHFQQTTLQAFRDAGVEVSSIQELLHLGVYFTTAVKCAKTGAGGIQTGTVQACVRLLQTEIDLFENVRVYLLMGDVAIKAVNAIAKREKAPRPIPAGATYKIRSGEFYFRGRRALPSYLQVGPSYGIEKSKQRMIAQDIHLALELAGI